jgi:PRC-barrel domain
VKVTGALPGGVAPGQALGREVQGPSGADVAEIEDVLVDDANRVAAVVLDVGGLLGLAERRVAVPVGMLRPAAEGDGEPEFVLGLAEEQLEQLPAYQLEGDTWARQEPGQP